MNTVPGLTLRAPKHVASTIRVVSPASPRRVEAEGFIRKVAFHEDQRCRICYRERLAAAAAVARQGNFDRFSTTLLYSRYQQHEVIREMGESIGRTAGVLFHYQDFRPGWQQGVAESRSLGMYRQKYCGCIYSEKERFFKAG